MIKNQSFEMLCTAAGKLGCAVKRDEPLKKHTSFRVGGPCKAMIMLCTANAASQLIQLCRTENIPFIIIGNGSNLLCSDKGYDGVVFMLSEGMQSIIKKDENEIICGAGCQLSRLSSYAMENGLSGLEFAWGIPGTVGGAVYMNAGAYGGEMKNVVKSVELIDRNGNIIIHEVSPDDFSYRHSFLQDNGLIATSVVFSLEKGNSLEIKARMDELMKKRRDKQPLEYASAGSTFKRPEGAFAAALIEQCGLKGTSFGGAEVSCKHSGFIINKGNATCEDILTLIKLVHDEVLEMTGYNLECEVKIIE